MARTRRAAGSGPERVRKNIDIDAAKLAAARRILGTPNDTATVDQALDDVIFVHQLTTGIDRLAAAGGLPGFGEYPSSAKRSRRVAEK